MDATTFGILLALAGGQKSATTVHDQLLAEKDAPGVPVATFYRRLNAAIQSGLILGEDDHATSRGRPGKLYALTAAGTEAMRAEARRLQRLAGRALGNETTP